MSMSGDERKLHDPDVSGREKLKIRLKRIARFWIGNVVGIVAVILVLIVLSIIYIGLPELIRFVHT